MKPNFNARYRRRSRLARGMTLAEVLVAMTVFVIAAAVALILYTALSQSYKRGDNAADVQQNTRLAFERLVTDARMAGFNYNPDGNSDRPDEQFEGAWDTAITFRGDFDLDDPTASIAPEVALAGGSENVVSTGNDEIVTYALAKPDGTGGQDLTFVADVQGVPRDGTTETVTISNLALVQDDPPYTLYRITVNPNSTVVTRTPVADNIYSLQLRYFDSGGTLLSPATFGDASDDIGGLEFGASVDLRGIIRRVELSIVGMTADPDMKYTDPDDPYPITQKHRKFTLAQDISPRNLGYEGRPDLDILPPDAPLNLAACPGQCQGVLLTWDAPPPTDLVSQWVALRGPTPAALGSPKTAKTNEVYMDGMAEGSGSYFRVRAEDQSGNLSPMSNLAGETIVGDTTTPEAPSLLMTTGGGNIGGSAENDLIHVFWPPVTTNVEAVACDPASPKIRDLKGYRLYRSVAAGPIANPAFTYMEPDALPPGAEDYNDTNVVACRSYWYDVEAVDQCGNASLTQASSVEGQAITQHVPLQPGGLQAEPAAGTLVNLQWARVTENTAGQLILVDTYRVYRAEAPAGMTQSEALSLIDWGTAITYDASVSDVVAPALTDPNAVLSDPGNSFYYRVSGLTDCSAPYEEGAPSDPSEASVCDLGGTIALAPAPGTSVAGSTAVAVAMQNIVDPAEVFSGSVVISNASSQVVANFGSGASPMPLPMVFTWSTGALPPGDYIITANVQNSFGCAKSVSHVVSVVMPVPCCIAPVSPVIGPLKGKISERQSDVLVSLVNNCLQDVTISRIDVSWTNVIQTARLEHFCYDVPVDTQPQDCTPVLSVVPPTISPAVLDFSPGLTFSSLNTNLDPLIIGYKYDLSLLDSNTGLGETLTMDVFFQTAGAVSDDQCRFQITTNPLDVVVVE